MKLIKQFKKKSIQFVTIARPSLSLFEAKRLDFAMLATMNSWQHKIPKQRCCSYRSMVYRLHRQGKNHRYPQRPSF